MGNTTERRLTGTVIGHTVKFQPKKVETRGPGITITKAGKIGALVTIQVDKKTYTVPSKGNEVILGDDFCSPEASAAVYDMLTLQHPFNAVRSFSELIIRKERGKLRKYELEE